MISAVKAGKIFTRAQSLIGKDRLHAFTIVGDALTEVTP